MRNTFFVLVLFSSLASFFSCDDNMNNNNAGGEINFRFKLVYGDQPLEMFKTYEYPGTKDKFQMTRLSFYITDLTIRSANGDLNIKDIDYLNLTGSHTAPVSANGLEYNIKGVKPGTYNSFDFGVGVPKILNAMAPKDFKSGHILSSAAEYWTAWKSYIFFRSEGQIALDGKPMSESPFALHLGGDDAFRSISLSKPIVVAENQVTHVDVILDIQNYFSSKSVYNIRGTQQIHSQEQMPLILQLAENLTNSFR